MVPPLSMLATHQFNSLSLRAVLVLLSWAILTGCAPPGTRALLDGDKLTRDGKYAQAIEKLKLSTELLPQIYQARAWNHLGVAYHGAGRVMDALAAYQEAIRRNPGLTSAHFNLGSLFLEMNNPGAALPEFTFYVSKHPNEFAGWERLGVAHARLRQWDAAEKCFQNARQLKPNAAEIQNNLGVVQFHKNRPREAFHYFSAALQRQSDHGPAMLNLAVMHHQNPAHRPLALQRYKEYLELKPTPANSVMVQEIVSQLELELAPPTLASSTNVQQKPSTNLLAISVTNAAPALTESKTSMPPAQAKPATNLLAAATHSSSKPALESKKPSSEQSGSAGQPRRTDSAEPRVAALPPVQEIEVREEPLPQPAGDSSSPPLAGTATGERVPGPAASTPLAQPLASHLPVRVPPQPEARSVTDRLNPLNWFRNDATSPEPIPATSEAPAATSVRPSQATARPAPEEVSYVFQVPPGETIRRYPYQTSHSVAPGDREKAEPIFRRALRAHQERRLAEALTLYREAAKTDPGYFEVHYNSGLAAYDLREWQQSLTAYQKALAVAPASVNARYNFALALQMANYPYDAVQELLHVVTKAPSEARAHFSLGKLFADHLSRPDLARRHYQRVLDLNPQHPEAVAIRYWLAAHP